MRIRWILRSDDGTLENDQLVDFPDYDPANPTAVRTVDFDVAFAGGEAATATLAIFRSSNDGTAEASLVHNEEGGEFVHLTIVAPDAVLIEVHETHASPGEATFSIENTPSSTASLSFSVDSVPAGSTNDLVSNFSLAGLTPGQHMLQFRAFDGVDGSGTELDMQEMTLDVPDLTHSVNFTQGLDAGEWDSIRVGSVTPGGGVASVTSAVGATLIEAQAAAENALPVAGQFIVGGVDLAQGTYHVVTRAYATQVSDGQSVNVSTQEASIALAPRYNISLVSNTIEVNGSTVTARFIIGSDVTHLDVGGTSYAAPANSSTPFTLPTGGLQDGQHTLVVHTIDLDSNVTNNGVSVSFDLDAVPDPLSWTTEGGDTGHRVEVTDHGGGYFSTAYQYNVTAGGDIAYVQRNTASLEGDPLVEGSWYTHSSTYANELPGGGGTDTGWASISVYGDDGDYQVVFRGRNSSDEVVSDNTLTDTFSHRTFGAGYSIDDATLVATGTLNSFSDQLYSEMDHLRYSLNSAASTQAAGLAVTATGTGTKDYSFELGTLTRGQSYTLEVFPAANAAGDKVLVGSQMAGEDQVELTKTVGGGVNVAWMQGYPYLNPTNYGNVDLSISVIPGNEHAPVTGVASFEVRFSGDSDVADEVNGLLIWITPEAEYGSDINLTWSHSSWDNLAAEIIFTANPAGSRGKVLLDWNPAQSPVDLEGLSVYNSDYSSRLDVARLPQAGEKGAIAFSDLTPNTEYEVVVVPILGTYLQDNLVWSVDGQADQGVFTVTTPSEDYSASLASVTTGGTNYYLRPVIDFGPDAVGLSGSWCQSDDPAVDLDANWVSIDGGNPLPAQLDDLSIAVAQHWAGTYTYYFRVYSSGPYTVRQVTKLPVEHAPWYTTYPTEVSGGVFEVDGSAQPTVDWQAGKHRLDLSDASCDGYPILLSTSSDGTHGGGTVLGDFVVYILDNQEVSEADFSNVATFNAATKRGLEYEVSSIPAANEWPLFYYSPAAVGMGGQVTTPQATEGTYNFTHDGSDYVLFGTPNPSPNLKQGKWYEFVLEDEPGNNGHPIGTHPMAFSLGEDGTHNGHAVYEDYRVVYKIDGNSVSYAVYAQNFAGATTRSVRILFPDTVNSIYYFCVNHAGMGAEITLY